VGVTGLSPSCPSCPDLQARQVADLERHIGRKVSHRAHRPLPDTLRRTGGSLFFFHPDHLGSGTLLTDANGDAYQFFVNLPFGEMLAEQKATGAYSNAYKFTGKELDSETGLYYHGARYYDPERSIWLSVDAAKGKYPSHNPYNYCLNNPVRLVDPDGRSPNDIVYFNSMGKEIYRIKSSTVFRTFVSNLPVYASDESQTYSAMQHASNMPISKYHFEEATMPGIITNGLDANEDPGSSKYQELDYILAAKTHLFNRNIDLETNMATSGYGLGTEPAPLDVNLVKALAYKESRLGKGVSRSTSSSDVLSMYNMGDAAGKSKIGMGLSEILSGGSTESSISFGISFLHFKSYRSNDGKTKDFQGWMYGVDKYGPGQKEPSYQKTVKSIYESMVPAKPENY
jgi:RHS repeat-associated protein